MNREGYAQSSLFRIMWETVTVFINRNSVLQKDSIIMLEQIRTIDKSRLLEYIGHLDCRDMRAVDVSLRISLDMGTDTSGTFWEERQKQGLVLT